MADVLKVGIIGCGGIARAHLSAIRAVECIDVVAMADMLPERAQEYAKEYGAKSAYGDYEDLLADPDVQAVHVCLPHDVHHPVCMAAAKAGKHILVEKPMALSVAESEDMLAAAEAAGVTLMVAQVLRFRTAHIKARELLRDGAIGQVRTVYRRRMGYVDHTKLPPWHADPKQIGNFAIYGFSSHEIDIILWLLDTEAKRAFATGRVTNPVWGNEDEIIAVLELANDAMATHVQSMNARQGGYDCVIVGTDGSMHLATESIDLNGEEIPAPLPGGGGMNDQIEEFARACLEGREPEASGRNVLKTMRALDAIWKSVQTGQVVDIQ